MQSQIVMSHIRYATQGVVNYQNTQPYSRELSGREHVFIHNGNLLGITDNPRYQGSRFCAIGQTDSEVAFCYLMTQMAAIWDGPHLPSLNQRLQVFNYFTDEMSQLGLANFIYSDSEYVFIYSDRREVKDKQSQNKLRVVPGLYFLQRQCQIKSDDANISGLTMVNKEAKYVVLISSVALNNENWIAMPVAESLVLKDGKIINPALIG